MTQCTFSLATHRPGVHACPHAATLVVRDLRPLPDGALRPPMPACSEHAQTLAGTNPAAYSVEAL